MDIFFISAVIIVLSLSIGYSCDEQLNYPRNTKHAIRIPIKYKKFFCFKQTRQRTFYLRAAFWAELSGYIEFVLYLLIAAILHYFKYTTKQIMDIGFIILGIQSFGFAAIYFYYQIRFRATKH